jgi:hypothetical protein
MLGSSMFIVGQQVRENDDKAPEFYFDVVGTTGNIYKVKIGKLPSCDCPDGKMRCRGECKHIIYGMSSVFSPSRFFCPDGTHCILLLRSFLLIELCQVLLKALNARPELQYQISFVPSVSRNSISHLIVIMADHLTL